MLIALLILAQTPQHALFRQPNLPRNQYAFFEAFPSSGAGTFGPCSATAPTGARGEVLTFTRASSATCTKTASGGLTSTGIANGDLVTLSSNVARVEYDAAGTLVLLVEGARTNSALRSQELATAPWALNDSGAFDGTITADFATAPDGTLTADRLQLPAVTAPTEYSRLYNVGFTSAGGTGVCSIFVKGNGTSGSIPLYLLTGFPASTSTCSYVSGSWTRCAVTGTFTAGGEYFIIGASGVGVATTAAQDILLWGADCEVGAYATSYIPTTSAAVTRAAEPMPTLASAVAASSSTGCMGVSVTPMAATVGNNGLLSLNQAAAFDVMFHNAGALNLYVGGASRVTSSVPALTVGAVNRLTGYWGGGMVGIIVNGTTTTAAASPSTGAITNIGVASYFGGNAIDGLYGRIIADPVATRCPR